MIDSRRKRERDALPLRGKCSVVWTALFFMLLKTVTVHCAFLPFSLVHHGRSPKQVGIECKEGWAGKRCFETIDAMEMELKDNGFVFGISFFNIQYFF